MALANPKLYTIDDIYSLPEGVRAELIEGEIYYMPPAPSRIHQKLVLHLSRIISEYILLNKGNCEVYPAPFAVFLNVENQTNYVEPDISLICDPNKLNDKGCDGAPNWIIEIVSPSNPVHDYIKKLNIYELAGVREYWIVDPIKETTTAYLLGDDFEMNTVPFSENLTPAIFNDIKINIAELIKL